MSFKMFAKRFLILSLVLLSSIFASTQEDKLAEEELHRPRHRSCSSSSSSSSAACCGCRGDPIKKAKENTEKFQYYLKQNMPSLAANLLTPNYHDSLIFHNGGADCCLEQDIFFELNEQASGQFTRNLDYHYNLLRNNTVMAKGTTFLAIEGQTKVFNLTYLWDRQIDCSYKLSLIYGIDFDCIDRDIGPCTP